MVIFLRDMIAVHDVRSGEALWQHNHKMPNGCSWLFITKVFTGFLYFNQTQEYEIQVFDTSNGKKIANQTILCCMYGYHKSITARGPYLCFSDIRNIHVMKFSRGKAESYNYPLAKSIIKILNRNINNGIVFWHSVGLLGFLGKSHVVIGVLTHHEQSVLFSFDIDAAVSAQSEEEAQLAFALPLTSRNKNIDIHCHNECYFDPVYRTDRNSGCIDMVGIMRRRAKKKLLIDTYFFETQLQY